jgi:hypothetical protein
VGAQKTEGSRKNLLVSQVRNEQEAGCMKNLLVATFMLPLLFDSEDGGNTFLRSVGALLPTYKALYPKIMYTSFDDILSELVIVTLNLPQISKYIISIMSNHKKNCLHSEL